MIREFSFGYTFGRNKDFLFLKLFSHLYTLGLIASNHAFSQVSTATDKIVVDSMTWPEMPNKLEDKCYQKDYPHPCFPKTTLTLTHKVKKHSYSSYIAPWEGFFYVHFVKLTPHSYSVDLDGDGFKEIAIYPEVAGNAAKTKAYIYTVKGSQLLPYGTAYHYWESGTHVTNIKKKLVLNLKNKFSRCFSMQLTITSSCRNLPKIESISNDLITQPPVSHSSSLIF